MSTPQTYKGNGNHDWELVIKSEDTHTVRLRIPGGWLYSVIATDTDNDVHLNTVFVPLPANLDKFI